MSKITYKNILSKAKTCKTNVKKNYKLGISYRWSYYFAKAILTPKKDITKINIDDCKNPTGSHISRQISKTDYIDMCKRYVRYIEKHRRFPNYLTYKNYQIKPSLLTEMLARILVWYDKNNRLPSQANINSKVFTKPTETGNSVYDYFVQKTGKKFTTIDDLLSWMSGRSYGYYYDDVYSNKECINRMINYKGINCTDSLQFLINMAEAMDYKWECLHVRCSSGTGHVRGRFKHSKHTGGEWIYRDPASVLNGDGVRSNWCTSNYTLLATNPSWFLQNLKR